MATDQWISEESKLKWHPSRVKEWLAGEAIAPITVDMALTRNCNMRCSFCYSKLQKNPGKEWSKQEIFDTLSDMQLMGVKGVSLVSDGESTLNPHWREAIQYARKIGLDVALGTNGLIDFATVGVLNALTYCRVNIGAAHPEPYNHIHGVPFLDQVLTNIRRAVQLKENFGLNVTLGIQMVLFSVNSDQIIDMVALARGAGVDYLQIKHCSDDEQGSLGVNYAAYEPLSGILKKAEKLGNDRLKVLVKWTKIGAGNQRPYKRCYGPQFHLQISGSGLVAPCGMFFGEKYKDYWIGNIHEQRFIDIFKSQRYWDVMHKLASPGFDAHTMCGCLCLQDSHNRYLEPIAMGKAPILEEHGERPAHVNFI